MVFMRPKADFGTSSFVWTAHFPALYNCVGGIEGSRRNSVEPVTWRSKLSLRVLYPNPNEWALEMFLALLYTRLS